MRCWNCGSDNSTGKKFCGDCGASLGAATPAAAEPRSGDVRGERRHLTVLFCDLVGSTGIAAQLDPEEWREMLGAYHRAAAEAITRYGGHVAKYLGDGVMAYFGWPEAHENDAERAARAGLAILEEVSKLDQAPPLPDMRTSQTRFPSASSRLRLTGSADAAPSEASPMSRNGGGMEAQS
jgi:class 3 adenylate cyclase